MTERKKKKHTRETKEANTGRNVLGSDPLFRVVNGVIVALWLHPKVARVQPPKRTFSLFQSVSLGKWVDMTDIRKDPPWSEGLEISSRRDNKLGPSSSALLPFLFLRDVPLLKDYREKRIGYPYFNLSTGGPRKYGLVPAESFSS